MNAYRLYPHPPLVLVTLEVRHPTAELSQTEIRGIKKLLSDELPIERTGQLANLPLLVSGGNIPFGPEIERFTRFMNRDATIAVSVRRQAIVVEMTVYSGWSELVRLAAKALEARTQISGIDGIERIGLRYINEIRAPGAEILDWSPWIHQSLLGPEANEPIGLPLNTWQGLSLYGKQPGQFLLFRYGPQTGFAVDPNGDLRRITADPGPYFLMDIDSSWLPDGGIPEYDIEEFKALAEKLHGPAHSLFEGFVTEKFRSEVMGNA